MPRARFGLLALLALAACASDEAQIATTQVTLRITSEDAALTREVTSLRAVLYVDAGQGFTQRSEVRIDEPALTFPLDIPILPSREADRSARLEVFLEAYQGTTLRAQTRAVTQFVSEQRRTVAASFSVCSKVCEDPSCHGETCAVCRAGACTPVGVAPAVPDGGGEPDAALPVGDATTQDGSVSDASSPPSDAGSDAAASDASTSISGVCPADHGCPAPYPCVPTAMGYTCRGKQADWPMPDAVSGAKAAPRFEARERTVFDPITKLEWQTSIPRLYPGCTGRIELVGEPAGEVGELCARDEARTYCEKLDLAGTGWRLPTLIELTTLLNTSREDRDIAIDGRSFGDTDYYVFTSASFGAGGPGTTWGIYYAARRTRIASAFAAKVRCVRGGAEPPFAKPSDRYVPGSGIVLDRATTLVWQSTVSPTKLDASAIDAYCASAGFRVPTTNELLTLVDPTREKPALDVAHFPSTPSDVFWSASNATHSSQVSFERGSLESAAGPAYVRCVRNE